MKDHTDRFSAYFLPDGAISTTLATKGQAHAETGTVGEFAGP
jgi:hypothetical protein